MLVLEPPEPRLVLEDYKLIQFFVIALEFLWQRSTILSQEDIEKVFVTEISSKQLILNH